MPDQRFPGFPDGLNNVSREDQMPATALRKALNVDLLAEGKIRRRKGYQSVISGTNVHDGFGHREFFLIVDDGSLKRYTAFDDPAPLTIATGVCPDVAYVPVNDEVIWSDGEQIARVDASGQPQPFGLLAPAGQPTLSEIDGIGGWFAGRYMVAITYERDGVESGAQKAGVIEIAEGSGIRISGIPQSSEVIDSVNVYVSQANGETLYLRMKVPPGATEYDIGNAKPRRALRTMFLDRLPASTMMVEHYGIIYAAVGNALYFSRPLNFGMYHTTEDYILFDTDITMLTANDAGVYVGTDTGVRLFRGQRPEQFTESRVSAAPIPGAYVAFDGGHVVAQLQGSDVVTWWTVEGAMIMALPDGSVESIRDTEFRSPDAESGVVAPIIREGTKQLVTVLRNPKTDSSLAIGDDVAIEVHRNGVT